MPVALNGIGNLTTAAVNAGVGITIDKPASLSNGDLLVAAIWSRQLTAPFATVPTGWTTVAPTGTEITAVGIFRWYYKFIPTASAETGTNYVWTGAPANSRILGVVFRVTGVDSTSVVDAVSAEASALNASTAPTITIPAVTTANANDALLSMTGAQISIGGTRGAMVPPSSMVTLGSVGTSVGGSNLEYDFEVDQQTLGATGSTGTRVFTRAAAVSSAVGYMIAIRGTAAVPSLNIDGLSLSPTTGPVPSSSGVGGTVATLTVNASGGLPNAAKFYTVDWSDGSTVGPQASNVFSHIYTRTGAWTITASVTQSVPMPAAEPFGFTRIYSEDFDVAYPIGSFVVGAGGTADDGRLLSTSPAYSRYYSKLNLYPDNNFDTGHFAYYYPSKVVSTRNDVPNSNGVLDFYLHTETVDGVSKALSAWVRPISNPNAQQQLYGRFSMRMRADAATGFGAVMLLISDTGWPATGEQDWPEGGLVDPVGGFYHYADPAATSGTAGNYQLQVTPASPASWQDWHVYTIEWTAGRTRWLIDDVVVLNSTDRVPNASQKFVLQSGGDGVTPAPSSNGHLQVDWITVGTWNG